MKICLILCILITIIYNGYFVWKYGIPKSLSETAYLLGNNKKYLFSLYCILVGITLLPSLFEITSENYKFIPFIFCICLLFAGLSPTYKEKEGIDRVVHYISSYISFAGFILYTALCMGWQWLVGYCIVLGGLCVWNYKSYVWFAEILALLVLTCFGIIVL